jgi:integrase
MSNSEALKLTSKIIQGALTDRSTAKILRDTEVRGLYLRIGPRSASYNLDYKPAGTTSDGKQHASKTIKVGTVHSHSLTEARNEAARLKVEVHDGKDPQGEKKAAIKAKAMEQARAQSMSEHADQYIATCLTGSRNHITTQSGALRHAIAEMGVGDQAPIGVTVADVKRLLARHKGRALAVHRFGALSRFFDELLSLEAVTSNPCASIPKRQRPKPPAPRSRVYSAREVQRLLQAEGLPPERKAFLVAAVFLPLRFGELEGLMWGHIDLRGDCLNLPAKLTKNGDPFAMPFPAEVSELLRAAVAPNPQARVFPLTTTGKRFQSWSKITGQIRVASGVEDFNFHDLRRTFMTTLAEHGVGDEETVDALLNHRQAATRSGVKAAYQHAKHWPAKQQIMRTWGDFVRHADGQGEWSQADRTGSVISAVFR